MTIEQRAKEIQSRRRVYTTTDERRELGLMGKGHGVPLEVGIINEFDRVGEGQGRLAQHGEYATTTVWLQSYGEFRIPSEVWDYLSVDVGDTILLTARESASVPPRE